MMEVWCKRFLRGVSPFPSSYPCDVLTFKFLTDLNFSLNHSVYLQFQTLYGNIIVLKKFP